MKSYPASRTAGILLLAFGLMAFARAAENSPRSAAKAVEAVIRPLMQQYNVPGMAVGIIVNGESQVYVYGVVSRETGRPVTGQTIFEVGSISKTFTATLAAYAQVTGHLSLSDKASAYLPSLRGGSFDEVSLLNLGTYTAGGLPLQVPDDIKDNDQLMAYFQHWKPTYVPGTFRTYSNPSIGLLGLITAKSLKGEFAVLMENKVFSRLGMKHTFLDVPEAQRENYAQGYTNTDDPIRMAPGVLAREAYGIRTTASDLVLFLKANLQLLEIDGQLQRAITQTHRGYYRVGAMTQDLIWEQYDYPATLNDLLAGNSAKVIYESNPVTKIDPPLEPRENVLINKTGSTNGFAAYVAFVPARKTGIVLLANKNYPIEARVTAAQAILARLGVTQDDPPPLDPAR